MDELLTEWGFPDLIKTFEEQEIDLDALLEINSDILKEIIPKVGPRLKFLKKLKELNTAALSDVNISTSDADCNEKNVLFVHQEDQSAQNHQLIVLSPPSSCSSENVEDIVNESSETINLAFHDSCKRKLAFCGEDNLKKACRDVYHLNIKEFLEKTVAGKYILRQYNETNQLTRKTRAQLAYILMSGLMSEQNTNTLQPTDFVILSEKIVELFPTETKATYYIPRVPGNNKIKPVNARGKLIDKFRNLRRLYHDSSKLGTNNSETDCESNKQLVVEDDILECMLWLKNNDSPWELVLENWKKTFVLRKNSTTETVHDFMINWPILKNVSAYDLISLDFKELYPNCKIKSLLHDYQIWENFFNSLKNVYPITDQSTKEFLDQLSNNTISQDSKNATQIASLPLLFPPKRRIKCKKNSHWKPSTLECREGLINIVDNFARVEEKILDRQNKFRELQLTVQPYLIVTGASFTDVKETYVVIDNFKQKMGSVLQGLDYIFKAFHALNASYPKEVEHIWLIFEKALYEIETSQQLIIPEVSTILMDLRSR